MQINLISEVKKLEEAGKPHIDSRLMAIAEMVPKGAVIADIGTDHGYLPAYLLTHGLIAYAYASDVAPGPLQSAMETVRLYGLEDQVSLALSDGLKNLPEACANTVIIAGMGSETINKIVGDCCWLRQGGVTLLLQPMTHPERLRTFLYGNGFDIKREKAVIHGGRGYAIMEVRYTGERKTLDALEAYVGKLLVSPGMEELLYIRRLRDKLKKRRRGLLRSCNAANQNEAGRMAEIIVTIEKMLGDYVENADSL